MENSEIEYEIVKLEIEISKHERLLERMSNPMKVRWRKRDLKKCRERLAELKQLTTPQGSKQK